MTARKGASGPSLVRNTGTRVPGAPWPVTSGGNRRDTRVTLLLRINPSLRVIYGYHGISSIDTKTNTAAPETGTYAQFPSRTWVNVALDLPGYPGYPGTRVDHLIIITRRPVPGRTRTRYAV
eukprot:851199-Rhodomonas_salina.1